MDLVQEIVSSASGKIEHTVYINFMLQGHDALKAHNLEGGALQNIAFNAADSVLSAGHHPVLLVVGKGREETISSQRPSLHDATRRRTHHRSRHH